MMKKKMYAHGGKTFNGHRCEKRNLCENMTGYKFDADGVGSRGNAPSAKSRPKNFIG